MTCEEFRSAIERGIDDAETRAHVRACDGCLRDALAIDPEYFFRSIGGEMEVPGGADLFVEEVMQQIHVRATERRIAPHTSSRRYWLAFAASVAVAVTSFVLTRQPAAVVTPHTAIAQQHAPAAIAPVSSRPVVENYEANDATIVQVPTNKDDVQVVMVFDQSLPADL